LPHPARRTITYDNGPENVEHGQVNAVLGTRSYFCTPYTSQEGGTVENTAGLVRRFFPTRTGHKLFHGRVRRIFWKLRRWAGIRREGGPRWQPRIHDLRHYADLGISGIPLPRICWKTANAISTVQELLGHRDVSTTMIYTHVLNRGGKGVRSPADLLLA
jgi:integrase